MFRITFRESTSYVFKYFEPAGRCNEKAECVLCDVGTQLNAFHTGCKMFVVVFVKADHWSITQASSIHSTFSHCSYFFKISFIVLFLATHWFCNAFACVSGSKILYEFPLLSFWISLPASHHSE